MLETANEIGIKSGSWDTLETRTSAHDKALPCSLSICQSQDVNERDVSDVNAAAGSCELLLRLRGILDACMVMEEREGFVELVDSPHLLNGGSPHLEVIKLGQVSSQR